MGGSKRLLDLLSSHGGCLGQLFITALEAITILQMPTECMGGLKVIGGEQNPCISKSIVMKGRGVCGNSKRFLNWGTFFLLILLYF